MNGHEGANVSTAKPEESIIEWAEELIRIRAYQLYEKRGCENGHDRDDWLQAETEITGKKPAAAEAGDMEGGRTAAVA